MPRVSQGTRTNRKTMPQDLPVKFHAGFLAELDGRTELARALRADYDAIVSDVGGAEEIGHVKSALIERFVWLEAILRGIEQDLVNGTHKADVLGKWIQAVNSLSGLAKVLGIERKMRTVDLQAYVKETGNGNGRKP